MTAIFSALYALNINGKGRCSVPIRIKQPPVPAGTSSTSLIKAQRAFEKGGRRVTEDRGICLCLCSSCIALLSKVHNQVMLNEVGGIQDVVRGLTGGNTAVQLVIRGHNNTVIIGKARVSGQYLQLENDG